ncbi:hypothetical protein DBT_1429 [Dissulfuribacter thermophilus]|uniref:Uncharacterized protein n=1 Tax=Dissulfuribacter thermophilus TaxID=1156395 RepID=A0A1B9F5V7_9BACT|nr:hypothetical protein DBT_1429 [Dissulfuribacter thermophilus]
MAQQIGSKKGKKRRAPQKKIKKPRPTARNCIILPEAM